MLLTSSVLSTTSKRCFEQPAARFLVYSLIFIEYKKENFRPITKGEYLKFSFICGPRMSIPGLLLLEYLNQPI